MSEAKQPGDIYLKTYISIIGTSDALAVEIDIANVHDTLEVKQQTTTTERIMGHQGTYIPPLPHLLETTGRKTAFDVGTRIAVVSTFIGTGCHPGLFYLEVMGNMNLAPAVLLTGLGE